MAENTKIEWAHHTFNPWIGCTKVGPGCDNCYAEADFDKRRGVVRWGAGQARHLTSASTWSMPQRWNRDAAAKGVRYRVFCASLADVFDNEVPEGWRIALMRLIDETPHLDWLLVTKRIGNVARMLQFCRHDHELPANVWLGATVVNQAEADRDIPKLLGVPATVRFLSVEPMLGPIDLSRELLAAKLGSYPFRMLPPEDRTTLIDAVDWVICGGESGPNARPMHPDWARGLRDQCAAAGVPFLFKQWGEWTPGENVERQRGVIDVARWDGDRWWISPLDLYRDVGHRDEQPDLYRVGKKAAGRLLDGAQHDGYPTPQHA